MGIDPVRAIANQKSDKTPSSIVRPTDYTAKKQRILSKAKVNSTGKCFVMKTVE